MLAADGHLGRRDELVAAVALRQDALLAAFRCLPQLGRPAVPHAALPRDRDAGEAGRERRDVVDDPRAGEQPPRLVGVVVLHRRLEVLAPGQRLA